MSRPFEKSKVLFRELRQGRKSLNNKDSSERDQRRTLESTLWVPDPRTGIYYPKGHEWVMNDIPKGAASFKQKYWLRSTEGTDKPIADPSANGIFEHPFLNM